MIGRFVQNDQIRFLQEKFAQGNPRFLPSGEYGCGLVKFIFGEAKSFQDACDLAFVGLTVCAFESMSQIRVLFHQFVQSGAPG